MGLMDMIQWQLVRFHLSSKSFIDQGPCSAYAGYLPSFTYSSHYIRDPYLRGAISHFLKREAAQMQYTWQALTLEASPYKDEHTYQKVAEHLRSLQQQ